MKGIGEKVDSKRVNFSLGSVVSECTNQLVKPARSTEICPSFLGLGLGCWQWATPRRVRARRTEGPMVFGGLVLDLRWQVSLCVVVFIYEDLCTVI